jgi:phosphoribosylglycinamide formyltransferase-1
LNIAIFLSGRGSNFLSISDSIKSGKLNAKIVLVGSNNADAVGLQKAQESGYNTQVFNRQEFGDGKKFAKFMDDEFSKFGVEYIVLAGYLRKMPPRIIETYKDRIINIHPALLPKFGGKGMYGLHVHNSVLEAGESETGVTIHFVDNKYDNGNIIAQKSIPVLTDDTPETLSARVLELEHSFYPEVLQKIATNSL